MDELKFDEKDNPLNGVKVLGQQECQHGPSDSCDTDCMDQEYAEPTDSERWEHWAGTNDICRICSNERQLCGGEIAHG